MAVITYFTSTPQRLSSVGTGRFILRRFDRWLVYGLCV